MSDNATIIIAPTFHLYEKYIDALVEILERNWPGHPELIFFSDNRRQTTSAFQKIIRSERSEWPFVVYNGCLKIKEANPGLRHVLLLNEEAFPLQPVNSDRLAQIFEIIRENDLQYVYFPCYDGQWEYDYRLMGESFCITPASYRYYTQLGPAFWNIDHLVSVCEFAISNGILTPWKVETIVTKQQHFISAYRWPTVADGLFKDGFININALKVIANKQSRLRSLMIKEYILSRHVKVYRWGLRKSIGIINRILHYLKKQLLVYPYRS